jgi:alpha-L-fucosidase 2
MCAVSRRRFLQTASTLAGALAADEQLAWPESLPENAADLRLWYKEPASQWVDALPIGNGRLGAMVFGGGASRAAPVKGTGVDCAEEPAPTDPARETLTLNDDTLWSGWPQDGNNTDAPRFLAQIREAVLKDADYHRAGQLCQHMQGRFSESYQPAGILHVDLKHEGKVEQYSRKLDLSQAVAKTRYTVNGVAYERMAFASAPDQAIVLRLTASAQCYGLGGWHAVPYNRGRRQQACAHRQGGQPRGWRGTSEERNARPLLGEDRRRDVLCGRGGRADGRRHGTRGVRPS